MKFNDTVQKIIWAMILAFGEQICQLLRKRSTDNRRDDFDHYR